MNKKLKESIGLSFIIVLIGFVIDIVRGQDKDTLGISHIRSFNEIISNIPITIIFWIVLTFVIYRIKIRQIKDE